MTGEEWGEGIDGVVNSRISGKVCFNFGEKDHRAVCASAFKFPGTREANGIVEGQAQRFMCVLAAFAVEETVLEIFTEREEYAALVNNSMRYQQGEENGDGGTDSFMTGNVAVGT